MEPFFAVTANVVLSSTVPGQSMGPIYRLLSRGQVLLSLEAQYAASTVLRILIKMTRDQLYAEYARFHTDARNRRCHFAGIPLIVLGLLGLLALARLGPVDLAAVAAVVVLLYYASLDPRGAVVSLVAFAILYLIAIRLPWELLVGALVLGWVFQLAGHRFEGNKPKFLENLVYLLIGPLYFFQEVIGLLRPSRQTV